MRGLAFLAVLLIIVGVLLIITGARKKSRALIEELKK
jgi:hypothetical protein